MTYRCITLRTGQLRRVSDHEVEVAVIVARDIVEDIGANYSGEYLDDRQRLALVLIAMVDRP